MGTVAGFPARINPIAKPAWVCRRLSRRKAACKLFWSQRFSRVTARSPRTGLKTLDATMPLSRREFAKGLAAATAVLPLNAAAQVVADEPQKTPEPSIPDPLRMEAALWLELIRTRYPDQRLTPEVLTLVAGDVLGDIMHCRRVSSFPLKNSDAPSFVISAWTSPSS